MKNPSTLWRKALPTWQLIAVTILISVRVHTGVAQTAAPTPPDKRDLGIENSASTSQSDQTKAKEAKPELVLQTGYNNFFGATRLVFSPDGRLLATATFRSSTIKVWDVASWRELKTLEATSLNASSFMGGAGGLALSPDGSQLARVADAGKTEIRFFDLTTGREARSVSLPHDQIDSLELCFAPDGHLLAAGIVEKKLKIWDVTTKQTERDLAPTAQDYSLIKFSRDGRLLALSEGYTIKLWVR